MDTTELKTLALFEKFSGEQLQWLVENSTLVLFEEGKPVTTYGAPAEALWVLIQGEWRLSRPSGKTQIVLNTTDWAGSWLGGIPLLEGAYPSEAITTKPSRFLRIPTEAVRFMLDNSYPIAKHLLEGLSTGARNSQAVVMQHEKMAALGKLSAGLAHELNNPAAAARRAAAQLGETIETIQATLLSLNQLLTPLELEQLGPLYQNTLLKAKTAPIIDSLTQSEYENDITAWLEDHRIINGWQIAATLASVGLDIVWLNQLEFAENALGPVLSWLEASLTAQALVQQVEQSAERISTLVKSVKEYSYMDQAPQQEVDIHQGLESTLTMLAHKLKNITVIREYDQTLPHIMVYGSQLNQVWTNLLDNAGDALGGKGQIWVRTRRDGASLVVEIADNGPGIPPDIQSRIFEPFLTTKGVGEGSGLGLDIVYRIIVAQHKGEVKLNSQPGNTCFQIYLPLA
jgi:signal transduction histidine kinase